jgi:hypothetical protein
MLKTSEHSLPCKLPLNLTLPNGNTISTEELIYRLGVLKSALAYHVEVSDKSCIEPLSYPEAMGLYDIASTAYFALSETFYAKELS